MDTTMFRETVAQVAAKAKAHLPQAVNGRIDGAVKLVLSHDVSLLGDGSIEVGSSSDPMKTYRLTGQACTCKDFTDGKSPEGWCRHRIAAAIAKRVRELIPPVPPVEPWPDHDVEADAPAPAPLPEALPQAPCAVPAIMSTTLMIAGRQVEVKLCDTDDARLVARLRALLHQFPVPQAAAAVQGDGWCAVHQVALHLNHGKDGRTWLSHKTPDGWCKGR